MLRFPLAILVVFVHGFGVDIDIAELHASGLTGAAVYDNVRLFCSVGMRNGMRRSVLGNENVHAKCDESADRGEK